MHEQLCLEEPNASLEESYRELVQEFFERGEAPVPFTVGFPNDDFPGFLDRLSACARGEGLARGFVPHSTYWLVLDGRTVVGVSNVRHQLTDRLRRDGGNIGYGVRPSARGRGFGTELLRQSLMKARQLGLTEVLITCARENEASGRTILRNRGVLESEEFLTDRGQIVQRYWIRLQ